MDEGVPIEVKSILGYDTGKPLVELMVGNQCVVMECEKAREIGTWLIEAGSAAQCDMAFFNVLTEKVGLDVPAAGRLIRECREVRS